ncbi:hypothetical protein ACFXGA_30500 [Actinosynnema sp. NPDC059335]|uniref:hypothetical protein n=1 Tax=Actinosynnema sp. NPDC059335 TaxID=3346804 RepID=UPI003670D486
MIALVVVALALTVTVALVALHAVDGRPGDRSGGDPVAAVSRLRVGCESGWVVPGWGDAPVPWDGGFVMAHSSLDGPSRVHVSADGVDWRESAPGDVVTLERHVNVVSGYGPAAYLLGWDARGPAVWRTEGGDRWESTPLLPGDRNPPAPRNLVITAGPRGVLVVGANGGFDTEHREVCAWYSRDGRSFSGMFAIPEPEAGYEDYAPVAAATSNDFLLGLCDRDRCSILSSADGTTWHDISAGFPQTGRTGIGGIAGNASVVVVERCPAPDQERVSDEPRMWCRRDGAWRPARTDPGTLPDAGVVPAHDRYLWAIRNRGTGFIAPGGTYGDVAGVIWHSSDGAHWRRTPVRDNGFDRARGIRDVVIGNNRALAFGISADPADGVLIRQTPTP